ncbi:MAG: hypothetical protein QM780_09570 [Hyphomicrobium sp.]|uniref:hypothetical protein n=1 Tax=Hyphomicrobium sp. TaxID=82 RepID=UPI0039E6BFB4
MDAAVTPPGGASHGFENASRHIPGAEVINLGLGTGSQHPTSLCEASPTEPKGDAAEHDGSNKRSLPRRMLPKDAKAGMLIIWAIADFN